MRFDKEALGLSEGSRPVRALAILLVFSCWAATSEAQANNLKQYRHLVVADQDASSGPPKKGVRVTYLGTNGYLLESRETTLLIDPYFSRVSLFGAALNRPVAANPELIQRYLPTRNLDAILVTHGHFDHLLDAPEIVRLTNAKLIASATSTRLAISAGAPPAKCIPVTAGKTTRLGKAKVWTLAARHDRLFCRVPFAGPPRRFPPRAAGDWVCGEPLAFLIEMGGRRIYVESGGRPGSAPNESLGRIDLAILGVALPDARERFPQILASLRARYVLPSHQDNFFRPLSRGFGFGPMTDFPSVLQISQASASGSSLILLDYFRPWTLP
jgi:L-ascorbate metabolism protein UlaG (beta-lactamase superfamily)